MTLYFVTIVSKKGEGQYGESWRKIQWNLVQDWVNLVTRYCGT